MSLVVKMKHPLIAVLLKPSAWFFVGCLVMLFSAAVSATTDAELSSKPLKKHLEPQIFEHCRFSGLHCLQHIDRFLIAAEPESIYWYELMLLKLDSLFILMRDADLYALTSKFVLKSNMPDSFKARLFIYHAKVLYGMNNKTIANDYLHQASSLLDQLNQAMPNPLTQLRLINVKLYSDGDYQSGYEQLLHLEKQLLKSHDMVLKYDLYNNLGHFTNFLKLKHDSLHYRQLAIQAIRLIDHPHKMAEAHYNLARAQSALSRWCDAETNFAAAMWFYQRIEDSTMVNLSLLYLAEAMWQQQRTLAATAIFQRLQPAKIPNSTKSSLLRIEQLFERQT
jgi:hypothetical protein